jgi:hypothetical protein
MSENQIPRDRWPASLPAHVRTGASGRDAFLWYVVDGWTQIFGDTPPVESVLDHDFGYHVLRKGSWELTLIDRDQFPADEEINS